MAENRIDPTAAPSKPPFTPGWRTSEFWLHVATGVALSAVTSLCAITDTLPPVPKAVAMAVCPLAMAWLAKAYNDGRVALKS